MNDSLDKKEQRRVLWRLLSYMKGYKKEVAIAFLLLILATVADLVGPYLVKVFIDDYLTRKYVPTSPLTNLALFYIGINLFRVVVSYFQLVKFNELALHIVQRIRVDVFAKMQSLGMRYFDQTPGGSIVSRVTNDTEAIKDMFVSVLSTMVQNGVYILGVFIAMFLLNVKLAFFCLFLLPAIFFIMSMYRKYSSIFYKDMRERLSQLNAKLSESLQGMGVIQAFRQEERLRQEFAEVNEQHFSAAIKNTKVNSLLLRPASDLVHIVSIVVVLSFFGIDALNSPIEIGVLYAFINYLDRFFEPINQMLMRLALYQQSIIAGSRVFVLLDHKEIVPEQLGGGEIVDGTIEFQNVSFSYDGKRDVLKNISFTVKRGETIALVGHTGSGKSSIINLLMRFYEFNRGEILVDNKSIRSLSNEELREKVGLVLQDPFLFFGTIKDNIRMYHQKMTDEDIEQAAEFVQAHTFIEKLLDRYEHKVVERGATLSSGQRQLLAFARTIAANPTVLVLDEATANIDTETEEAIQAALANMRQGRTTIAIAHRLSTIQDANQILVLHQGEVVEHGNHQELLEKQGLYYKMYLLQNGIQEEQVV